MIFIADDDLGRIRKAVRCLENRLLMKPHCPFASGALPELLTVLSNISRLQQEQPNPVPKIKEGV